MQGIQAEAPVSLGDDIGIWNLLYLQPPDTVHS